MKDRFYMACTRDNVGSNMAWHAKDGAGYTTDLSKAHEYTRDEAQKDWERGREIDVPVSADHVDSMGVLKVDMQVIPCKNTESDCGKYVAFKKDLYDGNDRYFVCHGASYVTDFSTAKVMSRREASSLGDRFVFIPFDLAESKKRMTFDSALYNPRVMTQGAGLKTPDHIRRHKRRRGSGKVRWNCPCCGRIAWQYNPYDFDGCTNIDCEEFALY